MRLGRFAKRFVEQGGKVTVVTASLEDYEQGFPRYNNLDFGILNELPAEVCIVRTKPVRPGAIVSFLNNFGLQRMYELSVFPDKTRIWHRIAIKTCLHLCNTEDIDVIYTSSNPLSAHLIGLELNKRLGLPWVAEYRDPWTTSPFRVWQSKIHFAIERKLEAKVLAKASKVILNTPVAKQQLIESFPLIDASKLEIVPNSFDPEAVANSLESDVSRTDDRLTIAYVGSLYAIDAFEKAKGQRDWRGALRKWFNTVGLYRIAKHDPLGRSPWYLFQALCKVFAEHPEYRSRIKLVIAGRLPSAAHVDKLQHLIEKMNLTDVVEYIGMIPHRDALALMRSADVLLLSQIYADDNKPFPSIPGKTYEYLAMEKPILGLLPPGDARDLVKKAGCDYIVPPNDPSAIAKMIVRLVGEHVNGGIKVNINQSILDQFRSDVLADRLWHLIGDVVHGPNSVVSEPSSFEQSQLL